MPGTEVAATVCVTPLGNDLEITMGAGEWLSKVIIGVAGWFIFTPAVLMAGWGIYMQKKFFTKIEKGVEQFLVSRN